MDNAGFNLYRSDALDGAYALLNAGLIPGQAPGSPQGAVYHWADTTARPGVTHFYQLEDVDIHGFRTRHGPAAGEARHAALLPLVAR